MKKYKKGFTLIELLAVIVLLAIVSLIATPIILNTVEDAKISTYKSSVAMLVGAADKYYVENQLNTENYAKMDGQTNLFSEIEISGEKPDSGEIYITQNGDVAVAIKYEEYCFVKNFSDEDIIELKNGETCTPSNS